MIWVFGDHELDEELYQLRRRGRPVPLEPKVFDVLLHLVRNRNRVVSKNELLDALWPGESVSDSVLPRCIAAARRAVRDDRSRQKIIQTVHGRGYRFVAEALAGSTRSASSAAPSPSRAALSSSSAAPAEVSARGFVGREAAMAKLRAALRDVRAGRGRVLLLAGEPGIGKTRTAEEAGVEAERAGVRCLFARCYEGEGAPAFWPWMQVLRALLGDEGAAEQIPELAGPGGTASKASERFEGQQVRFRLFDAVTQLLSRSARDRPLAITLDNLHWADADSLHLFRFLAGELRSVGVLLLASYRDVEVRRGHPLRALLGELARESHCERVSLRGLERPEVAALISALAGVTPKPELLDAVTALTEGNPFFVREVVGLLLEEGQIDGDVQGAPTLTLPQGVRDAVGRRLDSLSADCNAVLRVASVIGRDFDIRILERVAEPKGEALLELLGEAEAAHVLAEIASGPGRYAFTHALLRQTLYEELHAPERLRLHRRVGKALAGFYGARSDAPLAELAHHFCEATPAGTAAEAVRFSILAAERAHAQLAYEESARHYERALEALDYDASPDLTRRCELLIAWGEELHTGGARETARARLGEAAELARRLGRRDLLARAALAYRGIAEMGVPDATTRALLEEARDALGNAHPTLRAQLLARLTGTPPWTLSMRTREELSREAWALARESDDPTLLEDVLTARYWATLGPDRVEERLEVAREARERAQALSDRRLALMAHEIEAGASLLLGSRTRAEAAVEAYARLAEELRQPHFLCLASSMQAGLAMNTGAFAEAETHIRAALERGRGTVPFAEVLFVGQVYSLLFLRGERKRVAGSVGEGVERLRAYFAGVDRLIDVLSAFGRADAGDLESVRRDFEALAVAEFEDFERDEHWLLTMGMLAELAFRLEDVPRAERLYAKLTPYAERFVSHELLRTVTGSVHKVLGWLATLLGRQGDAVAHFERAIAAEEAFGARPAVPASQAGLALALERRDGPGDAERAQALRKAAEAGVRLLGVQLPDGLYWTPRGRIPK